MDANVIVAIVSAAAGVIVGVAGLVINVLWIGKSFDVLRGSVDTSGRVVSSIDNRLSNLDSALRADIKGSYGSGQRPGQAADQDRNQAGDSALMQNLITPALTSLAEYLDTAYRPDREYIDGTIEERSLGEYDHANLQSALVTWFRNRQGEWKIRAVVEQRIQVRPTRFRVPDATVIDRAQAVEQILTQPPLLVIEVLSPDDTWPRMEERIADYLSFGIPNVWVLDPAARRAWAITPNGRSDTNILQVAGSAIAVSLEELFQELE